MQERKLEGVQDEKDSGAEGQLVNHPLRDELAVVATLLLQEDKLILVSPKLPSSKNPSVMCRSYRKTGLRCESISKHHFG